jgi:hypothetical protein
VRLINTNATFAICRFGKWKEMMDAIVVDCDENTGKVMGIKKEDKVRLWTSRLIRLDIKYKSEDYAVFLGDMSDIIGVYDKEDENETKACE